MSGATHRRRAQWQICGRDKVSDIEKTDECGQEVCYGWTKYQATMKVTQGEREGERKISESGLY